MHVCACECMFVCMCEHVGWAQRVTLEYGGCRPEVDIECLLLVTLFLETGSH